MDARALRASGLGRYLREVLSTVLRDERFGRVLLLGRPPELRDFLDELGPVAAEVRLGPLPGGIYSLRTQAEWVRHRAGGPPTDATFFPHFDTPQLALPPRSVVTVHDLTPLRAEEGFPPLQRAVARLLIRRALSRAVRVITGSEHARADLEAFAPGARDKLVVIPHGAASETVSAGRVDLARVDPLRPFVLCVGNRKPHKNLVAAVETLARLRATEPELRLVFAGRAYPGWEEVLRRAGELGVLDAVEDLGEVDDALLSALYARCEALLFPSLYEGFGLPVVEAMHHGAPVIASDRASLPEVAGDAAVTLDPFDHRGMAEAVLRLRRDPRHRDELVRKGRARAAEFTWERAARRTADVLHDAARTSVSERPARGAAR